MNEIEQLREERVGLNSIKWSAEKNGELPFWIADMDFKSPDFIARAFAKRAEANYFGYTQVAATVKPGIVEWYGMRHQISLSESDIILQNGVKSSYVAVLQTILQPADAVILLTPIYPPLINLAKSLHHEVFESELVRDAAGAYQIDFSQLEEQIATNTDIKALVICNPHNPIGHAWSKSELEQLLALAKKYELHVISDEIHTDLTFVPQEFTSIIEIAAANDFTDYVVLGSPAKAFNVAGLKASFVISKNHALLERIDQTAKIYGIDQISLFGAVLLEAVYTNCAEASGWLDDVLATLKANYEYLQVNLKVAPGTLTKMNATYLAWLKVGDQDSEQVKQLLQTEFLSDCNSGTAYSGDGVTSLRINFGCPMPMLELLVERLNRALTK